MTEQSLRATLEPLIAASEAHGARIDFQLARFQTMLAQQAADLPLAAHPVGPAPVVTDEAVEAACERMHGPDVWQQMHASGQETKRAWMRFALEAAAPLLAPRPLLDREAVLEVLAQFDVGGWKYDNAQEFRDRVSAALLSLARTMPTEVEIAERVRRVFMDGGAARTHAQEAASEIADAVMALLNGAES